MAQLSKTRRDLIEKLQAEIELANNRLRPGAVSSIRFNLLDQWFVETVYKETTDEKTFMTWDAAIRFYEHESQDPILAVQERLF